jgi:hypothetical protein
MVRVSPVALAICLLLGACRGFGPPRAETLARLRPHPAAEWCRSGRFVVELASPGLSGVFDAVAASTDEGLRVQLFPDVGGKVLDLLASPAGITASMPGHRYEAASPLDEAPVHLALVLAPLFAELLALPTPARVQGERTRPEGGAELRLTPWLGAGEVVATTGADGAIDGYRLGLSRVRIDIDAAGRVTGPYFQARILP